MPRTEPGTAVVVSRILDVGLVGALLALAVQTVLSLTNAWILDDAYRAINVDEDGSVFTWPAMAATFTAGLAAMLLRILQRAWQLSALAAICAFLSFDDFFGLHERVGRIVYHTPLPDDSRYLWPILFLPLFALAAGVIWQLARRAGGRIASFLRGGILLLAAAVVLETIVPGLNALWTEESWQVEVEITIEEGLELVGWILIATGLLAVACRALARDEQG